MGNKIRIFRNWDRHQKKWYAKWHLYLGIIAGAIIAVVGITGSILVFRDEIDNALNPGLFEILSQQKRLTPDAVYAIFHHDHPGIEVNYIYQPGANPNSTYIFYHYKSSEQIFINPYNGKVCGSRLYESGFVNIVMDIHRTLLIPVVGQYVVATSALILIILTISGMRLWMPKKWKKVKDVLSVNFKANWRRQNYDWHNVLGFYSAPIVVLLALTGFFITFYLPAVAVVFSLNGKNPQVATQIYSLKSVYQAKVQPLTLAQVLEKGKTVFPFSIPTGIAMPSDSVASFRIDYKSIGRSKDGQRDMVAIDQYSGKVLGDSRTMPNVAQSILSWLQPIHYGTFGGLPTQVLALLGGLIPAALFVTGIIIWWPRWKKQRKKNPEQRKIPLIPSIESTNFYWWLHFKFGVRYALWIALISAICGACYGLIAGIIIQPAVFAVIYMTVLTVGNFAVASVVMVFNLLFLMPFKKGYRPIWRYFAISCAFCAVFVLLYMVLVNTGLTIF